MPASIRRLLRTLSTVGALCAVAAAAPAAQADLLQVPADLLRVPADRLGVPACSHSGLSRPFASWGDQSSYALVPGGDFERNAWDLRAGARQVIGSEPFAATGRLGLRSLSLPVGASAQSPRTCVDAAYPTMRVFIAGTGLVLVQLVDGGVTLPVGVIAGDGAWGPSAVMITGAAVPGTLSGGTAQVSLRFTALTGTPRIDDVFIDPWNRG